MKKIISLLCLCFLIAIVACTRTGLKKHYTRISPQEFASYDSVILSVKSKYGVVYHVYTRSDRGFKLDFLVFEKITEHHKAGLFKMDEQTEIKNDSTFLLGDPPLIMVGDTINWPKGLWFYSTKTENTTNYKVDTLPPAPLPANLQRLTMGIYQYENRKLIKVSTVQSEQAFTSMNKQGFFFLPGPGRFYTLANFRQIE